MLDARLGFRGLEEFDEELALDSNQPFLIDQCAGIGSARLAGALLEAEWSTYTLFAVCFEIGSVAAVLLLFARAARR